jgi:hypothetical protein
MLGNGGFTELRLHGCWQIDEKDNVRAVRRYADEIGNLCWAVPQDWMFTRPPTAVEASSRS